IENDELDGDQVIAHVELHARVLERGEAAFVGRQLLGRGLLGPQQVADHQQRDADAGGDDQEQQGRQVFGQHSVVLSATCRVAAAVARRVAPDASVWCPRGASNPHDLSRYHLKVVRLPIPPPGHVEGCRMHAATARDCKPSYCVWAAGSASPWAGASSAGAAGTADSCCGVACGASGTPEVAAGAAGTATARGAEGAAGHCDITPRSPPVAGSTAIRVAYQAMNRVIAKNTIASHLVALLRKLAEPRAPNTVADAPPPKPEPADAPAPRCIRISATIAIATRTNRTLRVTSSIATYSGRACGSGVSGPPRGRWRGNPPPPARLRRSGRRRCPPARTARRRWPA